jgi:hypothetical protein
VLLTLRKNADSNILLSAIATKYLKTYLEDVKDVAIK